MGVARAVGCLAAWGDARATPLPRIPREAASTLSERSIMVTGYEVEMYQNIAGIRRALDRIATALETLTEEVASLGEAQEKRGE